MELPQIIPGKLFASVTPDGDKLRHEVAVATNKKIEEVKEQEGDATTNAETQKRLPHIAPTTLVTSIVPPQDIPASELTVQRDSSEGIEGKTGRNINLFG